MPLIPLVSGLDLTLQESMAVEKWKLSFPPAIYYVMLKSLTQPDTQSTIVGEPGTTKFDPLYRESIDPSLTVWKQPHLDPALNATEPALYAAPINVPLRFQLTDTDTDLHPWGFSKIEDAVGFVPIKLLQDLSLNPKQGDYLIYNTVQYDVLQVLDNSRWANSGTVIYKGLTLKTRQRGS